MFAGLACSPDRKRTGFTCPFLCALQPSGQLCRAPKIASKQGYKSVTGDTRFSEAVTQQYAWQANFQRQEPPEA
jgi:hypothetical protein